MFRNAFAIEAAENAFSGGRPPNVCGAQPGEQCERSSGQPRTNPHRERFITKYARLKERKLNRVLERIQTRRNIEE